MKSACQAFITVLVRKLECTALSTATAAWHKRAPGSPAAVNRRALFWGLGLGLLAVLILSGRLPGTDTMAQGPRIGIGAFLLMLALLVLGIPFVTWSIRTFTRPADYEGSCPVGESCSGCGAFNLKPRQECRSCGGAVNRPEPS